VVCITLPPLNLGESSTGTHWTEGWLCQRVALNTSEERKILLSLPGIEQQIFIHPACSLVTILTTSSQPFNSLTLPLLFPFHFIFTDSFLYAKYCNKNTLHSIFRDTYKCTRSNQKRNWVLGTGSNASGRIDMRVSCREVVVREKWG